MSCFLAEINRFFILLLSIFPETTSKIRTKNVAKADRSSEHRLLSLLYNRQKEVNYGSYRSDSE